ncbi:MAG TPA: hypothetical protein VGE35_00155 [Candidatus Paceibacterota bacterium]
MDEQLEQTIKEAYQKLPDDMKKAVTSLPIMNMMEGIAAKNNLHIDQVGNLYTETVLVLLGLQRTSAFVGNVQKAIGVSAEVARAVAQDVNDQVFVSVRASLQKMAEEGEFAETLETADVPSDREQLLAEIEDPAETNHPAFAAQTESTKQGVANEFIGSKLTQTVTIPSQKTAVNPEAKPKGYAVDPYRESI